MLGYNTNEILVTRGEALFDIMLDEGIPAGTCVPSIAYVYQMNPPQKIYQKLVRLALISVQKRIY